MAICKFRHYDTRQIDTKFGYLILFPNIWHRFKPDKAPGDIHLGLNLLLINKIGSITRRYNIVSCILFGQPDSAKCDVFK